MGDERLIETIGPELCGRNQTGCECFCLKSKYRKRVFEGSRKRRVS